jgi:hypothetical protein
MNASGASGFPPKTTDEISAARCSSRLKGRIPECSRSPFNLWIGSDWRLRSGGVNRCDPGPCAFFAFFCCRGSAYAATSLNDTFFHDGKAATLSPRGNDIGIRRCPQSIDAPIGQLIAGVSNDCCCGRHSQRRPIHFPTGAAIHPAKRDKPTVPAAYRNANLGIKFSGSPDCSFNDFPRL